MNWNLLTQYLMYAECTAIVALGFVLLDKNPPAFALIGKQRKPKNWTEVLTTVLKYIALAPVVAPYLIFKQMRAGDQAKAEMAYWRNVTRSHYKLLLEPLNREELPNHLWDYVEEQSSFLIPRGFVCLGDFRTKSDPAPGIARYFLSLDGEMLLTVGEVLDTLFYEATTFLEDGTVVVSANAKPFDLVGDLEKGNCFVQCLPESEFASLLEEHRAFVVQACRRNSAGIRELSSESWRDYARYSNLRFSQIKYEAGKADAPPPSHEFPRWVPSVREDVPVASF